MDIRAILTKRASLWEEAKKFFDEHSKDGLMSEEDAATYDKMNADIDNMTANIKRLERHAKIGAELDKPFNSPITEQLDAGFDSKTGRASKEYKAAMLDAMRTNFKSVRNELKESVDASGGYLVPDEWDTRLIDTLAEENIMRRLGTIITTSGEHKINITANKPAAVWVAEGAALTFGNATFAQKSLDAHKLHVAIKVTNELLYDNAFNLENYILDQFGKAIGNAEEDAFLNGDGSGKPTGLFTTAALAANNPIETTGAALVGNDIIDLAYALKRPYRRNAAFIVNDATLATIRKLKDQNQAYLWQPSYQAGEPDRLFGYPVYTSAYAPLAASGTAFLAFGDFSYYNIGDRGTRSVRELRELFAGNDMTGFLMLERVDALLVLPEAVKVLKLK
ncbi:MAG: phage major capsid protein [Selenomonadaceae bacterium]|nr:phage major capsid protein [Selenomonadaceae bacterium]